jgi:hypothetical protein
MATAIRTDQLSKSFGTTAASPDWTAAAWLVGLGYLAAVAGILPFGRRDLVGV